MKWLCKKIMIIALVLLMIFQTAAFAAPGYIIGNRRYLTSIIVSHPTMLNELNKLIESVGINNLIIDLGSLGRANYSAFRAAYPTGGTLEFEAYAKQNPACIPDGTVNVNPDGTTTVFVPPISNKPHAPYGLFGWDAGSKKINIQWNPVDDVDGYYVYWSYDGVNWNVMKDSNGYNKLYSWKEGYSFYAVYSQYRDNIRYMVTSVKNGVESDYYYVIHINASESTETALPAFLNYDSTNVKVTIQSAVQDSNSLKIALNYYNTNDTNVSVNNSSAFITANNKQYNYDASFNSAMSNIDNTAQANLYLLPNKSYNSAIYFAPINNPGLIDFNIKIDGMTYNFHNVKVTIK